MKNSVCPYVQKNETKSAPILSVQSIRAFLFGLLACAYTYYKFVISGPTGKHLLKYVPYLPQ